MEYINDLIRRKDRLLPEDEAMILLENGECGVLSMVSPEVDGSELTTDLHRFAQTDF